MSGKYELADTENIWAVFLAGFFELVFLSSNKNIS